MRLMSSFFLKKAFEQNELLKGFILVFKLQNDAFSDY